MTKLYKLVIFTPLSHADIVRQAMGDAGAGAIGNYSHTSFSTTGHGRFFPLEGAHPAIGDVGKSEVVEEERIEVLCIKDKIKPTIDAIKKVHPYEELAFDIIPLMSEEDFA